MNDLDEHLAAIAAGDAGAFGRWLAGAEWRLRDSLRPFAAHVDTEAVLQEALLRVWQVAPRFVADGRPNGLLRLGIRIARNRALDEARRRRETVAGDLGDEAAASVEVGWAGPDPMLRAAIAECRERLPHKPAQALAARLSSAGGDADETLAERLGMRLNTFLQNFTRARKLLGDCLKRRGVDVEMELG